MKLWIGLMLIVSAYFGLFLSLPWEIRFAENYQTLFQVGGIALFLGLALLGWGAMDEDKHTATNSAPATK